MNKKILRVTAAVITDDEGLVLLCQRPEHKSHPLLWEFPGGKIERDETEECCIVRECQEELNVTICNILKLASIYSEEGIQISYFSAKLKNGSPVDLVHKKLQWVMPEEVLTFPLCPNDQKFAKLMWGTQYAATEK